MNHKLAHRDTRCISAAFSFLKSPEYCPDCGFSTDASVDTDNDAVSNVTANGVNGKSPSMKKSESIDTALRRCRAEEERNAGEGVVKVCVCDRKKSVKNPAMNGHMHGGREIVVDDEVSNGIDHRDKDLFINGSEVVTMHRAKDRLQNGETEARFPTDMNPDEVVKEPFTGQNASQLTDVQNGVTNISLNKHEACVKKGSESASNGCDCESRCNCGETEETEGVRFKHQVGVTGTCKGETKDAVTSSAEFAHSVPGNINADKDPKDSSCQDESYQEETQIVDGVPVEMRPNRRSLRRRSTETGVISDAFGFLPTGTDSVFLPSGYGATAVPSSCVHQGGHASPSLSAVVEEEAKIRESLPENKIQDDVSGKESVGTVKSNIRAACECVKERTDGVNIDEENNISADNSKDVFDGSVGEGGSEKETNIKGAELPAGGVSDVKLRRPRLSKQESINEDDGSGDSSDEDAGIYSASFRRSNWMRIDDNGELELAFPAVGSKRPSPFGSRSSGVSGDATDGSRSSGASTKFSSSDEQPVFDEKSPSPLQFISHKRTDSTTTTTSEKDFKKEYFSRRRFLVTRKNSSLEYHRFSARVYDEEKTVVLAKGPSESDFGLHILDSQPAFITQVDPGSAAERAGVEEGQILVAVNGENVLSLSHYDIVAIISNCAAIVQIEVATSDFQPSRDLQAPILEGHMQKLDGATAIMKRWKRRYFVLRQDSCLYYYKQRDETDPLGAIPLAGYTFSRHLESGKEFCFKAEKYGARTYYFMTENRDEMTEWVGALSDAAGHAKKRKESFVSVSSHNVGLPALEVRRPECTGYLIKVGDRHKTWHRRYCVLKDACLYYYKNMNSLSALGVAHLHGYKVDPSVSVGKKHAFGVIPPEESLRTFYFSAENDTDRQRWVDAMIRSIQRWIQIDNDC